MVATHPDLALGIGRRIVDDLIAPVRPRASEEAVGSLSVQRVLRRNRPAELARRRCRRGAS